MSAIKRRIEDSSPDSEELRSRRKKVQNRESQKKYRQRQSIRVAEMERNLRDMQAILDSKLSAESKDAISSKRILELSEKNSSMATGLLNVRSRLSSVNSALRDALALAASALGAAPRSSSSEASVPDDVYNGMGIQESMRVEFKLPPPESPPQQQPAVKSEPSSPFNPPGMGDAEYLRHWLPRRQDNSGFMTHAECYDTVMASLSSVSAMNMSTFERILSYECERLLGMLPGFKIFSDAMGGVEAWPKPVIRWQLLPCSETYNMIAPPVRPTDFQLERRGRYTPLIDLVIWPCVRHAAIVHQSVLGFDDLARNIWACAVIDTKYGAVRIQDYDDILRSKFMAQLLPELVKNGINAPEKWKLLPDFIDRLPFMAHESLDLSHLPVFNLHQVTETGVLSPLPDADDT